MTPFFVIPEIFNRESTFLIFPLIFFNTMDPGLKIAGVTKKGDRTIQGFPPSSFPKSLIGNPSFCFFFGFKYCGPRLKNCRGDGLEETSPLPLPASSLNRHREHGVSCRAWRSRVFNPM